MSELGRSLTMLVHGASKSGKSTFAISTPAPRLLLDVEGGARFLPIRPKKWDPANPPPEPDGTWNTAVVQTRDWGTVEKTYGWLETGDHPFRALSLDSVSEVQQRHIEQVGHRRQMTQAQWGDTFRAVTGLIRDIRDLTMHPSRPLEAVVMTAMTRQINGMWRPWCQGQTATILPYLLDVTGYLWIDLVPNELTGEVKETRKLLTRWTPEFEAGERVGGKIPRVVELRQIEGMMPNDDGAVAKMVRLIFGPRPETPGSGASEPPLGADPTPDPVPGDLPPDDGEVDREERAATLDTER